MYIHLSMSRSGLVGVATGDQRPGSDSQRTLKFMQTETLRSEAQDGPVSSAEGSGPGQQQHRFESETATTQQEQDLPLAALQQERMGTEMGEGEGKAEDVEEEENRVSDYFSIYLRFNGVQDSRTLKHM